MTNFHKSSLSLGASVLKCLFSDVARTGTQQTDVFKRSALKWLVQITPGAQKEYPDSGFVCKGGSGVFRQDCSYDLAPQGYS